MFAPLSGDFGGSAAIEMVLVGGACGAVGVWVLHFGRAVLAESFTHALLPGLVIAAMIGAGMFVGALIGVVVAYALLLATSSAPKTSAVSATSVSVTMLVALGAILASTGSGVIGFENLLFGDPLAADARDLVVAGALAAIIAITLWAFGDRFAALAFDRASAPTLGVNASRVGAVALALLTLSVAVSANVAGSLLALTLVTGPALGAAAITSRLKSALWLSAGVGAASGIVGIYVSYYLDWPSSASIALVLCAWAALASAAGMAQRIRPRSVTHG